MRSRCGAPALPATGPAEVPDRDRNDPALLAVPHSSRPAASSAGQSRSSPRSRARSEIAGRGSASPWGPLLVACADEAPRPCRTRAAHRRRTPGGCRRQRCAQSYRAEPDGSTSSPGVVLAEDIVAVDVGDDGLGYAGLRRPRADRRAGLPVPLDANTGTFSDPLPMVSSNPARPAHRVQRLRPHPGRRADRASCEHNTDQGASTRSSGFVTLEPGQAVLTAFPTTGTGFPLDEAIEFGELATDPISGTLWAFGQDPSGTFGWWTVARDDTLGTQVEVDAALHRRRLRSLRPAVGDPRRGRRRQPALGTAEWPRARRTRSARSRSTAPRLARSRPSPWGAGCPCDRADGCAAGHARRRTPAAPGRGSWPLLAAARPEQQFSTDPG